MQAEATRRDFLAAARRLFAEQGYAATTMAAIAEAAGAAGQTIYDSVGPKRAILEALLDVIDVEEGCPPFGSASRRSRTRASSWRWGSIRRGSSASAAATCWRR